MLTTPFFAVEWAVFLLLFNSLLFKPLYANDQQAALTYTAYFLLSWSFSSFASKFYSYERNMTYVKQLQRVLLCFCYFTLFSLPVILLALGQQLMSADITTILTSSASFFCVVALTKAVSITTLFRYRRKSHFFQQAILICDSSSGENFINDIIQLKRTGLKPHLLDKNLLEPQEFSRLQEKIVQEKITDVYIPIELILKKSRQHLLSLGWENNVRLKFIADTNYPIAGVKSTYFGLTQVVSYKTSPLDSSAKRIQKRVFDFIFSLTVTVFILSWAVPIIAIIILIDSKGPIFFIQNRPGQRGKLFKCFKFRSMKVNKATETTASRNDSRITRIGKFLRKTSIDELPQFFNVLLGQMSVVGPRPNLSSQNEQYSTILEDYSKRMYLKPGITGLAQVSGARGGIEKEIEMKHRVKYDIFYIRNWSFALDIKIIIRTVLNILRGEEKAY